MTRLFARTDVTATWSPSCAISELRPFLGNEWGAKEARQNRPEYLYFSPIRLILASIAGAIAVGAISAFAVIQIWPEIETVAQRHRAASVATIVPQRVYAVPEPTVAPTPATSSSSTHSTSSTTTEASVPAIDLPLEARSLNSRIPPIERRLKGDAFWAAQKARVEAITALVHERWARTAKGSRN